MKNKFRTILKESKFIKTIKINLKTGLVPGILIILSILIASLIIQALNGITRPLFHLFDQFIPGSKNETLYIIYLTILSLTITFLLLAGLGAIIATIKNAAIKNKPSRIVKTITSLLLKVPLVKKILNLEELLEGNNNSSEETRGLVIRCKSILGFDTLGLAMKKIRSYDCEKHEWIEEFMTVLPHVPIPTSGLLCFVPVKDAKVIGKVTTDEMTKLKKVVRLPKTDYANTIISCGLSAPSILTFSDINTPFDEIQKILSKYDEQYKRKTKKSNHQEPK